MMWRLRYYSLLAGAGALTLLTGCGGLNDQQLTSIWQSVISTGLNTIVGNFISLLFLRTTA